jgi:Cu(I)/Ag(I) efflux system membrane protein CusA/SilA
MPLRIIEWSLKNRLLVLFATLFISIWGWVSVQETSLDAIPDLSDVQVIIKTSYPGQSPRVIEEQVTYPITTTMMSVPGTRVVRGYSFFGDSYVYVIFDDDTDIYWARSRVLEYLNQVSSSLPNGVVPRLGPDASGVGWIYSYALVDRSGTLDLSQLRSLQDWFLKYELQGVQGVSEVATVGGMVKQYQVVLNPEKLRAYGIPVKKIAAAIRSANHEVGGSVIEMAESEYMIRTRGYISSLSDIEQIPIDVTADSIPILLQDLAHIQIGPEMRRAVAELDGEGEVTGGIVVMRYGKNALTTISAVKEKLESLKSGLPDGVEIVETYDRSGLITRSVDNLTEKLLQELIVIALVCLVFLFHIRSSFVAIVTLPLGILIAFIIMRQQGINANIMSLGGIAITIGAMVDAAIVMIENVHKHLERAGAKLSDEQHWRLIGNATAEVGPALFYSLLIITLSFVPVFALEAQEGKLFSPLVFTKTFAMAAAAGLSVTLVPVLMGYFIRGKVPAESNNPIVRILIALYRPLLGYALNRPRTVLLLSLIAVFSLSLPLFGIKGLLEPAEWSIELVQQVDDEVGDEMLVKLEKYEYKLVSEWRSFFSGTPWLARLGSGLGSEFMPDLFEGDLMYMPTTLPSLSIGKARELLQQCDRLIRQTPEVERVFGKIGRAETATDPAPLTMIETFIKLKPREQWRPQMTLEKLRHELDQRVKFPGLSNAWVMPIKTRIDMLSTGIKTPIGVKVAGDDIKVIEKIGLDIEQVLMQLRGTASVYSERVAGGRYIEIIPKRLEAARLGINIEDINEIVSVAVGGINITQTVEGRQRYPVNLRFPREQRDDVEKLRELPLVTSSGAQIPLAQIAEVKVVDGPPMLKSENGRLNGWTFVDIENIDLGSYVDEAKEAVQEQVRLPPGYSISWSGQYEYMLRAHDKLLKVVPMTLLIIFILLYLIFRRTMEAILVLFSLPFALVGGFWLLLILDYNLSVAVTVGFIALAGVAAEFGVIMLIYLNTAIDQRSLEGKLNNQRDLKDAIMEGAVLRVRPKAMTVSIIIAGLLPIMISEGTGSEVMQRIAAPMIGGMITAPLLSMFVLPAFYYLWKCREMSRR